MTTGSMVMVRRVLSETKKHRLFRPKGEYALLRIKEVTLYWPVGLIVAGWG